MNGSWLTASTAGTLSTAKITSVNSTRTSTANSGVASRLPLTLVNRSAPSYSSVLGTTRAARAHELALGRVELLVPRHEHAHGGEDQEAAEHVEHPLERLDQGDAGEDEDRPQHEGAEDAPEQDPVLVLLGHLEVAAMINAQTKTLSMLRLFSMR